AAARERGALFVVDEAHALGTTGPGGRGGLAQAGVRCGPDVVVVGTLGKALGSYGAFVACSRRMRDLLASRMRTAIYSTALPPPVLAASLAAVRKLRREPGIVDRLHDNARALRSRLAEAGLRVPGEPWGPILSVVVGSNSAALAAAAAILERGVLAPALRPPTVPEGMARIRISVSAAHTPRDIDLIARAVSEAVEAAKGGRR
ncbi:MAG: aminotransferase class I/II-fold pyridoxal phosphate-dependent enzyme, partial [Myxococcota bacterium]|nr:aminotransferase class I/II-fold pyridoxal phosphate-dependent enzyme [Myxococcota bacterium]